MSDIKELLAQLKTGIKPVIILMTGAVLGAGALFFYTGPGKGNDTLIEISQNSQEDTSEFDVENENGTSGSVIETGDISENPEKTVVDASGAFKKPGIYIFEENPIMADVIRKAGGISEDASNIWVSRYMDLSDELSGNVKVYVPFEWEIEAYVDDDHFHEYLLEVENDLSQVNLKEPEKLSGVLTEGEGAIPVSGTSSGAGSSSTSNSGTSGGTSDNTSGSNSGDNSGGTSDGSNTSEKINVNTASASELEALNGIGPKYAERIVAGRPYVDFEELKTNSGVPASTLEKVKDNLSY